jgi:hypothetical protein
MEILKEGDIILTGDDEKLSRFIKKYTKGSFSHAILYVGHGSYIHSDRDGVHSGNIQRLVFESSGNVRILRLDNKEKAKEACSFARLQVGKGYSIKGAINSKIKSKISVGDNRQYCSKLVAQAYNFVGIQLVDNPELCIPKEIEDCTKLTIVNEAIRVASDAEIEFAHSPSPLETQANITNHILENARKIIGKDIQTLTDLSHCIFQKPKFDQQISRLIKDSGYLTLWDGEKDNNPWRYDYSLFMDLPIQRAEKLKLAERELKSSSDMIERFSQMLSFYIDSHRKTPLEYTTLHIMLYQKLCEAMTQNNNVAKQVVGTLT